MAVRKMNAAQFELERQGKMPLLIEFMAPWCVYCRRITPALEQIAEEYGARLVIGQINIDDEPKLASQEKVEVVPTFILYRDGQAAASVAAPDSKAKIDAFLRENLTN